MARYSKPEGAKLNEGSMRRSEKTPLLDTSTAGLSDVLVNKSMASMPTGVSWGVAAFLLVNTALGAGMLNYPYAYNQIGGVLPAALMQIVLLLFITSTMFILVYCADFNQDDTYHDVLLSMCGKRAQQISAISILLTCYGINITFLVIIGDQYDRIFNSLLANYIDEFWFLDRKFTITITAVLFIWPMCYAQRLDFLRHASILGMFAMLYVAFLTVYEHYRLDFSKNLQNGTTFDKVLNNTATTTITSSNPHSVRWFEPLATVPILCFAYQTHEVIVPVYACMKQRYIGHFMKASVFGLIMLFFLYNLVGTYGYLSFGAQVDPDIMSLYDGRDPVVVVGIVALIVKFITTYPPLMFCGRGALDKLYGEFRQLTVDEFKQSEKIRRIIITTAWFLSTVLLAVFAPNISVTLQILGSMAAINVFVFPGVCLVSLTRRLRYARICFATDDESTQADHPLQRAKDYYVISGSYFGAMRRKAELQQQYLRSTQTSARQPFTATFANLIEFENSIKQMANGGDYISSSTNSNHQNLLQQNGHSSGQPQLRHRPNGYGSQLTKEVPVQSSFGSSITPANGLEDWQDNEQLAKSLTDSYEEYDYPQSTDRQQHNLKSDMISPVFLLNNGLVETQRSATHSEHPTVAYQSIESVNTNQRQHQDQQYLQTTSSWKNKSATGSILERLGSSIAPSTVALTGISKTVGLALYAFAAFLILFGAFIFVLELVLVFGLL